MKKYSLHLFSLAIIVAWLVLSLSFVYLNANKERSVLLNNIILEKINLARIINDFFLYPFWQEGTGLDFLNLNQGDILKEKFNFKDIKYIRILDKNGIILQSNNEEEQGKKLKNSLVEEVVLKKETIFKDQEIDGEKIKEVFYPGYGEKIVLIGFSLKDIDKQLRKSLISNFVFVIIGAIFIIFFTSLFTKNIVNPLKRIISVFEEIKKGNLEARIDIKSKNEIGELADVFNSVINDLREYQKALEEAKISLEIRVMARTKELKELTESLEEKIKERTKELHQKIEDLEKFHRLAVGRELKMIELKKEIKRLNKELNKLKELKSNS